MIHASIIEHYSGEERDRMNDELLERSTSATEDAAHAGALRYARPGEIVDVPFRTVPVHEAISALAAAMPRGR